MRVQSVQVLISSIGLSGAAALLTSPLYSNITSMGVNQTYVVTQEYSFGEHGVFVQHRQPPDCQRSTNQQRIVDLSPASCIEQCTPGSFQPPEMEHCEKIIHSLLNNRTGSLQAQPKSWVYVYYKSCVAVLENPEEHSLVLEYNWAILGKTVEGLKDDCLNSTQASPSIGGSCSFPHYQDVDLKHVQVSLQRLSEFEEKEQEAEEIEPDLIISQK